MILEGKDDEAEFSTNAPKAFNTSITHFRKQKAGYFVEIYKSKKQVKCIHYFWGTNIWVLGSPVTQALPRVNCPSPVRRQFLYCTQSCTPLRLLIINWLSLADWFTSDILIAPYMFYCTVGASNLNVLDAFTAFLIYIRDFIWLKYKNILHKSNESVCTTVIPGTY